MDYLLHLVEALQHGNLAIFLGGDLPQEATGLPGRAELAAQLAQRLGLAGAPPPWPAVAAQDEAGAGLNALIRWLREQVEPAGRQPGPIYSLLAQLPVAAYITTAHDSYLYEALRDAGRSPNLPVVDASSLGLLDAGRPTVIHLFGTYDRPASLVLTATHMQQLAQSKAQILAGLVHPTLANKSVLIVGQDLRDTYFQSLYQSALFQAGTIRPPAYAAWPDLADWEKQTWLQQQVRILDVSALELLGELVSGTSPAPPAVQPDTAPLALAIRPAAPTPSPQPPSPSRPPAAPAGPPLAVIRDLLLAAFTADDLRRLFLYSAGPLHAVGDRFAPGDGLEAMVEKAVTYCHKQGLLPALLAEVQAANPAQYAHFAARLADPAAGTARS